MKHTNIHITGVPEVKDRGKKAKNLFKQIVAENLSNLGKERDIKVQESQIVLNKINLKRSIPRHTELKW